MKFSRLFNALIIAAIPLTLNAKPNVLLMIADDMGLDASMCYNQGNHQAKMPNIERMCAQGLVFDNAYAAPVCSPTRASMITGQYGFRTGIGAAIPRDGASGLATDTPSLFDLLNQSGYSANIIGKWHLAGGADGLDHPSKLGVPDYFGLYKGRARNYSKWKAVNSKGQERRVEGYSTTVFTDKAIEWIAKQEKPWFLWLAYNAPHSPFHIPPKHLHSAHDLVDDPKKIKANPLPYYNAMLEALDTEIGRLMASMDAQERDNTVFIFMGDNGSPNQVTDGFYGDHAAKGTLYDSGVHVPFVVSGKGVINGRTQAFVNTTDMFSTVAAIANIDAKTNDSHSFLPVLQGGASNRDYIYVEHFTNAKTKRKEVYGWALRMGDYKLISPKRGRKKLFNLVTDPLEQIDLIADGISSEHQKIVDSLVSKHRAVTQ